MAAALAVNDPTVPMSWETFLALDDSSSGEFFGGCLMVPPAPDRHHQDAVFALTALLKSSLPRTFTAVAGWGWRPRLDDGERQSWTPDITVAPVCDDVLVLESVGPELLVEVTSSNYATDMVVKRLAYARAGVPHYWVLDRRQQMLRVFTLSAGPYIESQTVERGEPATLTIAGVQVVVDLDALLG